MSGSGTHREMVLLAKGRHCFVSFAIPDQLPLIASVCSSFAVDNGAFSAWRKGVKFDYDGYYTFVQSWMHHPNFDWAVIPDIIDGSEQDNDALLDEWTMPYGVPVYHLHESLGRLERLIERYDYICLGSSGKYRSPNSKIWWQRMHDVMSVSTDEYGRPKVKMHGLRMLNPKILCRLPLKSADSTNAERNGLYVDRFGLYPSPTRGQRAAVIADRIEDSQSAESYNLLNDMTRCLVA